MMSDFWIFQNLKKPKKCKTKIRIISDERTHICINSLIGPIDMHVKKTPTYTTLCFRCCIAMQQIIYDPFLNSTWLCCRAIPVSKFLLCKRVPLQIAHHSKCRYQTQNVQKPAIGFVILSWKIVPLRELVINFS